MSIKTRGLNPIMQNRLTAIQNKASLPLDNMKLSASGIWSVAAETIAEKANRIAKELDAMDANGQAGTHERFEKWLEYQKLHDELVASGKYVFDDNTGFWSSDSSLPWDPSPYYWTPDPKPESNDSTKNTSMHVCEFVDVGFQFSKFVCKTCNAEKK